MKRQFLLFLTLTACVSFERPSSPSKANEIASVVFIGEWYGSIEPCGCSPNMRGGIAKIGTLIRQRKKETPNLQVVDVGNSKCALENPPLAERESVTVRAELIEKTLNVLSAHSVSPGAFDLCVPQKTFNTFGADGVAIVAGTKLEDLQEKILAARENKKLVIALVETAPLRNELADVAIVTRGVPEIGSLVDRSRAVPKPVVFFQGLGRTVVEIRFAPNASGIYSEVPGLSKINSEVRALETRDTELTRQLKMEDLNDDAKALRKQKLIEVRARASALREQRRLVPLSAGQFQVELLPVENALENASDIKSWVDIYNQKIGALNVANAQKENRICVPAAKRAPEYVGSEKCQQCHPSASDFFAQTKHAHAFETLERLNKNQHVECVSCHVTGYQQPSGPCRIDKLDGFKNVGCESCHGQGSLHLRSPISTRLSAQVDASVCTHCHTLEHSPLFDYATYVTRIVGPGHASRARKK